MEGPPSITTMDVPLENSPEEFELQSVSKPNVRGIPMAIEQELEEPPTSIVTLNSPLENITGQYSTSTGTLKSSDDILKEEFPGSKLCILLVGNTGVGKSSLINALFGEDIAPVTHGPSATKHELVEEHVATVFGVELTIYDTRGLSDPDCRSDKIISETKKVCKEEVDIVLICYSIIDRMGDESGVRTLHVLAKSFDENIWKKCILVLTKANLCEHVWKRKGDELVKLMYEYINCYMDTFHKYVQEYRVTDLDIPVCIAGDENIKIPTVDNWILDLFHAFSEKCSARARSTVLDLQKMRMMSLQMGKKAGAFIGGIAGATILPLAPVTVPLGATAGYFIGKRIVDQSYKKINKKIKEHSEQN